MLALRNGYNLGVIFSKIVIGFQSKAAPKIWLLLFGITEMDFFRLKYVFKLSNPQCLALGVVWMTVDAWMTR